MLSVVKKLFPARAAAPVQDNSVLHSPAGERYNFTNKHTFTGVHPIMAAESRVARIKFFTNWQHMQGVETWLDLTPAGVVVYWGTNDQAHNAKLSMLVDGEDCSRDCSGHTHKHHFNDIAAHVREVHVENALQLLSDVRAPNKVITNSRSEFSLGFAFKSHALAYALVDNKGLIDRPYTRETPATFLRVHDWLIDNRPDVQSPF